MLRRLTCSVCLLLLALQLILPAAMAASAAPLAGQLFDAGSANVPVVDPDYIYNQLFYMVTHYQRREAGYDDNLPVSVNGHDEFAAYWSQEMVRNLGDFGAQVVRDPFGIKGWRGRPAKVPAFNVEVSVPGITHPAQIVVIGCHYDGEAISNQSAFDDASGCAIELGVARALSQYWRATRTYPARTLRFVIFDAEEQGLWGSFHYLDSTINGDVQNIVAMFNEEQNGIAYPLRYLGKLADPLYPFYISLSPLQKNGAYRDQDKLSPQQKAAIARFRSLMQAAIAPTFALFRSEGFQDLTYHSDSGPDLAQPIFTPDQAGNVVVQDDPGLGSDQVPFTLAGVPSVTFSGNYQPDPKYPQIPAYPYDTPVDTIQLMNTFADGSSQQSQALTLALALPGQLTAFMLDQPGVLGSAPADGLPIAAIADIGQTTVNQAITFDARASFDAQQSAAPLTYNWSFGDGTTATGISVKHLYKATGVYTLTLTVRAGGARRLSKIITVTARAHLYDNPYASYNSTGIIPTPPGMPTPNASLSDAVSPRSLVSQPSTATKTPLLPATLTTPGPSLWPLLGFAILVLAGLVLTSFILLRRRRAGKHV